RQRSWRNHSRLDRGYRVATRWRARLANLRSGRTTDARRRTRGRRHSDLGLADGRYARRRRFLDRPLIASARSARRPDQALCASGYPASFSRIAIGALSGAARLERRTMKVCSRAYWPLRQAWLALSVKTIHVEPAGNSQ